MSEDSRNRNLDMNRRITRRVQIDYVRGGKLEKVHGKICVLACFNSMVPYLCPELPAKQKGALHYCVQEPFIYTHVALRN